MKKILVVSQYFWPETFKINDLVTGLLERGYTVTVLTGLPNYPQGTFYPGYSWLGPWRQDFRGARVFRVPLVSRGKKKGVRLLINYLSFAFFGLLLGPVLIRGRFDCIFTYEVSPVTVALPAILLKWFKRAPMIFWVTDLWPESLQTTGVTNSRRVLKAVSHLVRFIYRNSSHILVSSRGFVERIMEQGVPKEKITYWPQWAEDVFTQPHEEGQNERPVDLPEGFNIVFAGNIGTSQGFETIVDAAERLRERPGVNWVVLGDGIYRPWLEDQIEKRRLQSSFFLLGQKKMQDVPAYLHHADCLLLSLKKDPLFEITLPTKTQPYLAAGRPIIASMDGEGARIIVESGAGISCPAGDAAALAEAVTRLTEMSKEEKRRMGDNGKAYFRSHFARETLLDKLETYINIVY